MNDPLFLEDFEIPTLLEFGKGFTDRIQEDKENIVEEMEVSYISRNLTVQ
jgi:hypothetical protein